MAAFSCESDRARGPKLLTHTYFLWYLLVCNVNSYLHRRWECLSEDRTQKLMSHQQRSELTSRNTSEVRVRQLGSGFLVKTAFLPSSQRLLLARFKRFVQNCDHGDFEKTVRELTPKWLCSLSLRSTLSYQTRRGCSQTLSRTYANLDVVLLFGRTIFTLINRFRSLAPLSLPQVILRDWAKDLAAKNQGKVDKV